MRFQALLSQFFSGGIMVGFLACGYFFFRFWKKTQDSLFGVFAVSFWILALERIFLLATVNIGELSGQHELRPHVYWFRFIAFTLIIIAFVMKNRQQAR